MQETQNQKDVRVSLNPPATLNQRSAVAEAIGKTGNIKYDFHDFNDAIYEALKGISSRQCAYLNVLVINNQIFKLKKFLAERGMKIITK